LALSKENQVALSSPGIGSNLDVNSIVQQLMAVESQPLTTLAKKEASYQAKLSAFGSVSGALSAFQSALAGLSTPTKFQALTASSGDATILTGSATSKAVAGIYDINVTTLAQAQTIASTGQGSTSEAIGSGSSTTLTFQFGTIGGGTTPTNGIYPAGTTFTQDADQATGTVTIDSTNNSLQGIRDAINKADIGVTATIVSDGSATPYRLVLSSTETGASSSMKITVDGDATLQGLLAYDPSDETGQNLSETTTAKDTALSVNGIAVSSSTKSISDAIQGVTLNLSKTGSTTLNVARDTASVTAAINGFVKSYNDLNKTLKSLTAYDPNTRVGGPLLGDPTIRGIQNELRGLLNTAVSGLEGGIRTLSDVGVSFQKDGTLAVNNTKLQNAITNNFSDIASLFSAFGTTTDSLVSFSSSTIATKAGQYSVDLTTIASQGHQTGDVDLTAGPITIDPDTKLEVTLNDVTASVTLQAGSYTAAELAALVQSAINGTSAFSTIASSVKATIDANGFLNLQSNLYGSASNVSIASGTGTSAAVLMGAAPTSAAGDDVAGTINGVAATGFGQYLTGSSGSAAEGLKLLIDGGSTGARGTITFSRGYADQLGKIVETYLGGSGLISGRTDGLNTSIKDIGRTRETLATRLQDVEKRYRAQFTALDTMLSSMTQTSSFLAQQLANLPKIE
jgi:flagellar hook-associated protein 2